MAATTDVYIPLVEGRQSLSDEEVLSLRAIASSSPPPPLSVLTQAWARQWNAYRRLLLLHQQQEQPASQWLMETAALLRLAATPTSEVEDECPQHPSSSSHEKGVEEEEAAARQRIAAAALTAHFLFARVKASPACTNLDDETEDEDSQSLSSVMVLTYLQLRLRAEKTVLWEVKQRQLTDLHLHLAPNPVSKSRSSCGGAGGGMLAKDVVSGIEASAFRARLVLLWGVAEALSAGAGSSSHLDRWWPSTGGASPRVSAGVLGMRCDWQRLLCYHATHSGTPAAGALRAVLRLRVLTELVLLRLGSRSFARCLFLWRLLAALWLRLQTPVTDHLAHYIHAAILPYLTLRDHRIEMLRIPRSPPQSSRLHTLVEAHKNGCAELKAFTGESLREALYEACEWPSSSPSAAAIAALLRDGIRVTPSPSQGESEASGVESGKRTREEAQPITSPPSGSSLASTSPVRLKRKEERRSDSALFLLRDDGDVDESSTAPEGVLLYTEAARRSGWEHFLVHYFQQSPRDAFDSGSVEKKKPTAEGIQE